MQEFWLYSDQILNSRIEVNKVHLKYYCMGHNISFDWVDEIEDLREANSVGDDELILEEDKDGQDEIQEEYHEQSEERMAIPDSGPPASNPEP